LVPGFPLDGGRVLRSILWWATRDLQKATRWASRAGQAFAWFLIAMGAFMLFGYAFPYFGAGAVQGLWLILIGWFLNNAARMSYHQLLMRDSLEGVAVSDIMRSSVETVAPDSSLAAVVQEQIMASDQQAFPVLEGDVLLGLLRLSDVRKVDRTRWGETRVREAMTPIDDLHTMRPGDDALDALRELGNQDPIPVVEGRSLVGVARRDDLIRWMTLQSRAA
jgi:predicted transcriptional regulator